MAGARARDVARYALAGIRLFNGTVALLAPAAMAERLGVKPEAAPAAAYALRLFGIRTVVIGVELLVLEGDDLDRSLRNGVLIHASDAVSAATAGARKQLPATAATTATVISTVNVLLALAARDPKR
ncbi:MAG TPA: hypothetical protein VEP73_12620 [Actinomycetota bacterium]|nr:hypothetical protein [Actinomycetota bacterium]